MKHLISSWRPTDLDASTNELKYSKTSNKDVFFGNLRIKCSSVTQEVGSSLSKLDEAIIYWPDGQVFVYDSILVGNGMLIIPIDKED